jgi:anaerobic dimethyl sulfoxide reductase subunit C (anchor subunit)/Tat-targeted selenate reductase subunit YnfH
MMHEWSLFLFTLSLHIAAGGVISLALVDRFGSKPASFFEMSLFCALALAGSSFSLIHLGDMSGAYRAFFHPDASWLSREAWSIGIFTGIAAICAFQLWRGVQYRTALAGAACCGLLAIFASAAVYASTVMVKWQMMNPYMEFSGASLLLGPSLVAVMRSGNDKDLRVLGMLFSCGVVLFVLNTGISGNFAGGTLNMARLILAGGGIAAVFFALASTDRRGIAMLAAFFLLAGEGLGRYAFFLE